MPKPSPAPENDGEPASFETAMTRLEAIVEQMDSTSLPLEGLIAHYEEGTRLVKLCEEKLQDAERKIEIITRKAGGKTELVPFEPDAKLSEPKPAAESRDDVRLF